MKVQRSSLTHCRLVLLDSTNVGVFSVFIMPFGFDTEVTSLRELPENCVINYGNNKDGMPVTLIYLGLIGLVGV